MAELVHVETTISGSDATVRRFAETFVRRRLAACANVHPGLHSVYWWKGKMEEEREALVVFKTTRARARQLVKALRREHPYDVPYIATVDVADVPLAYVRWLTSETRAPAARAPRARQAAR